MFRAAKSGSDSNQHGDMFLTVAVTPDGQNLISGGHTGRVYGWDVPSGELRYSIEGHDGKVQAVDIAPDGLTMATAGEDNQIHLWRVRGRRPHRVANWA